MNKKDFYVLTEDKEIIHICEGTGGNLLSEDVDDGYVDYIYYSIFKTVNQLVEDNEDDGGMVLLKTFYVDLTIEEIIAMVEDMSNTVVKEVLE